MNSSPVFRQQSPNKIRSDFLRSKNEHNKMSVHPKPAKLLSTLHVSNHNIENRDPGNADMCRKAPVRPGVSRLPVLAKSLRLQTPSDFGQAHCRWEEKPLAGKTKKKKPCTRPVPFNFSQPKSSKAASENQPPLNAQSRTGAHAVRTDLKINAQPAKHPAPFTHSTDSTKAAATSNAKAAENTFHHSGQPAASSTFTATLSNPPSSIPHEDVCPSSAEACVDNLSLLTLTDQAKAAQRSQHLQPAAPQGSSKGPGDKAENFQSDHAALLSILRNEGVGAAGPGSTTPHCKVFNFLPQRVPVTKSRPKAASAAGSVKSVQFSPDAAALQSILQNQGVKDGGPAGATPRISVCPSGRASSIYTAQRVPLRKNPAGGAAALRESPQKKWTPQRVPNTRHRPMSSMKCYRSTPQSLCGATPGLRSFKTNMQPQQEVRAGNQVPNLSVPKSETKQEEKHNLWQAEEIVQRLFDDQDDEQSTDEHPETRAEPLQAQAPAARHHCGGKDEEDQEEQRVGGAPPFLQAPQRESVIFFSTGKTLLRAPRFEKQESSARREQQQGAARPGQEEAASTSEGPIRAALSLHRDLAAQRTCALSPAVALLRKRLPPLEELLMDEEVASYTSVSVPAALGFIPPRPRCGNPLASILHLEESSRFVPISLDVSSPRRER